jgi:glycine cleavage system transcriptional repressor
MSGLVISAVGPDRPGIVDALSEALSRVRANIADSRMVNLAGQFALIVRVEAPAERTDDVERTVRATLQAQGLDVVVGRAAAARGVPADRHGRVPYRVRTYAMDQIGLVHRITHLLHGFDANVEELETRLEHGAHSGAPLFNMDLVVTLPATAVLRQVREALETLCDELNCDVRIEPTR